MESMGLRLTWFDRRFLWVLMNMQKWYNLPKHVTPSPV